MAVERDPRHVAAAHPLVVAQDHELLEMPAVLRTADAADRGLVRVVAALPVLPRPTFFGFFLVAIVIGERAQCGQMLRAMVREPAERILAVEGAPGDAEVRRAESPDAQVEPRLRVIACFLRGRIPVRIEMGEQRRTRLDRAVVPKLELGRIGSGREPLEPAADAGGELGGIAEAHGLAHLARRDLQ